MTRLPNHVEEHAAMDRALAKLRATAARRPNEPELYEQSCYSRTWPVPKPAEVERWPRLWGLVGYACIVASACFVAGIALAVMGRLGLDDQAYLVGVLATGGVLVLGIMVCVVALGAGGQD